MSIFSINPLDTQALDLMQLGSRKAYQTQIAQCLVQLQSVVSQLASSYSPSGPGIQDFGVITTDQSWNVNGNLFTFLRLGSAVTQTRTITLTGFPQGGILMIDQNVTANTLTLKLSATDGGGHAYAATAINTSTTTPVDLVATGIASASRTFMFGMSGFSGSNASPQLNLLFA